MESVTAKLLPLDCAMTSCAVKHPNQHTLLIVCVSLALLVLPLLGAQHCQIMHDDHHHAAPSLAETCCVFLCFTALVGLAVIPMRGLTLARAALPLQPVRLTDHLLRWVPPPRPIGSLA